MSDHPYIGPKRSTLASNPRRHANAELLASYLVSCGGKVILKPDGWAKVQTITGLERSAIEQAADDLCGMGLLNLRMIGDTTVLEIRSDTRAAQTGSGSHCTDMMPARRGR